jgi:hypothetical protein
MITKERLDYLKDCITARDWRVEIQSELDELFALALQAIEMQPRPIAEAVPNTGEPLLLFIPEINKGLDGWEVSQLWGDTWWTSGGPNGGSDMDEWNTATHFIPLSSIPKVAP